MISVILNVYDRQKNLNKQIQSLLDQSIKINIENIHVWYNFSQRRSKDILVDKTKTYQCNWNTKFFGRFSAGLLCQSDYVAFFDDDILPQKNWIKNCLESSQKKPGIYGGSGVILNSKGYRGGSKVGWNGEHSKEISKVDLVGHAWFMKKEYLRYMWYEEPISWDNGEDILLSYLAQKYGNVNTYVPPHPESDKSLWSTDYEFSLMHGNDENASYKKVNHYTLRDEICKKAIDGGWKTVKGIK